MADKRKKTDDSTLVAKEIREFMAEHRLDDLVIERGKERIEVRSGTPSFYAPVSPRSVVPDSPPAAPVPAPSKNLQIRSPMAGTFYIAPTPGGTPYVNVGDKITADTVVCVIEAMKVMNEIKSGVAGKVAGRSAENAASVESGAVLFEVDPAG